MSNRVCYDCGIVYHMISDSALDKRCKKCGGKVWYSSAYSNDEPEHAMHDHMWSSIIVTPEFVDPDYEPQE